MCYCDNSDRDILEDIQHITIPSEALVRSCCWSRICQVRGRNYNLVDARDWEEICTKRGYLLQRQNPRGY
jgi:hypothetical protein